MSSYIVWSNPLAALSNKLFKTTWGYNEIDLGSRPIPNKHPLVPELYRVVINGTEYLVDKFDRKRLLECIYDNNTSMNELIDHAQMCDKRWMLIWKS
ncbi:hypothetical protein PPPIIDFJ_00158 [Salmonella phage MET_P1_179_112]|uniref:Uncharacterized protein n=1 Tax=Salmonella phage MET_P1_179_112 TaxID=3032423 RepID=A0AAF0FPR5_9CAUD|nr:hypothetical protein PPPIIDFJ_00158 [Salmonella phage MET_P1_179_112]